MKEYRLRTFRYACRCGFVSKVHLDAGVPMEMYKCRLCGSAIKREEL